MAKKVLVVYGSLYGATAEIAEKIGETLRQDSLKANVLAAGEVTDVSKYDAFVIGSAIYAGFWRKDAVKFVEKNLDLLIKKPVWIFSSGPTGEGDIKKLMEGWEFPKRLIPAFEKIKPRANGIFHGAADAAKLNIMHKLMLKMVKAPTGDFRKWDEITVWAEKIAKELKK